MEEKIKELIKELEDDIEESIEEIRRLSDEKYNLSQFDDHTEDLISEKENEAYVYALKEVIDRLNEILKSEVENEKRNPY